MQYNWVTWRFWVQLGAALSLYAALGFWLSGNSAVEAWLYRIGLTAGAAVPLAFTGLYTWFGLRSDNPGARWWKTELGSALVLAALSLEPITVPLAVVFWAYGGQLTATWLAWCAVSGPALSALAWLRVCWLWLRVRAMSLRQARSGGGAPP